jgi:2-oxoglutarate dehydrogenase E2 component (dihydrolipoamide succinyltransferase)
MAFTVQMPALGESVTEGTVTRWLKQEGDRVEVDEPLLEVSTDKVDTEIPSPAAGVLERIVAGEDETVEVGAELAVIGDGDGGGDGDGDGAEDTAADDAGGTDADDDTDDDADGGQEESAAPAESEAESGGPAPQYENKAAEPAADSGSDTASDAGAGSGGKGEGGGKSGGGGSGGGGTPVLMPELGESVTEGTVTRWLKQVGDSVEVDEPLLEVSTDKVDTEIPSPIAGTLLSITADEDATVEVGAELAVVGDADGGGAPADGDASDGGGEPSDEDRTGSVQTSDAGSGGKAGSNGAPTEDAPVAEADAEAPQDQQPVAEKPAPEADAAETARADEETEVQETPDNQPQRPSSQGGDGDGDGGGNDGEARRDAPYVTPLVRKLAAEHGVDLAALSGSGVGGRVRKQDVLAAAEKAAEEKAAQDKAAKEKEEADRKKAEQDGAKPAAEEKADGAARRPTPARGAPEPGSTVKMPRLRQVIAQRMTESLRVSAQLTTVQEVDVTRIARLRARAKAEFERREGVKLTYLPFFAKAVVEALRQYPQLNASIDGEGKEVTYHGSVHLGIAVDTPRGLLVPVVENADELNIAGLARHIADLAARTRDNKVGPKELQGGTFTITNIGSSGALFDTPIINQPQVAILGTGAISKQPKVVEGPDGEEVIAVRSVCFLPLTYDHRLVDGADAGRFVSAIRRRLEEGAFDAELGL